MVSKSGGRIDQDQIGGQFFLESAEIRKAAHSLNLNYRRPDKKWVLPSRVVPPYELFRFGSSPEQAHAP